MLIPLFIYLTSLNLRYFKRHLRVYHTYTCIIKKQFIISIINYVFYNTITDSDNNRTELISLQIKSRTL